MILETIMVEPFIYYDTIDELKNAYFSIVGDDNLKLFKRIEKEQMESDGLLKRVHNFTFNEFEKYVIIYKSMWKSKRNRENNLHYLELIKKIIEPHSWYISDYNIRYITNYKMWMKKYYIEHVMLNNDEKPH